MSLKEAQSDWRSSQLLQHYFNKLGMPVTVVPRNHPLDYCDAAIELETRAALEDFMPGATAKQTSDVIRNGKSMFDNPLL